MNERIKELIEQATTIDYGGDRGFDQVNPQATFDKEKFAELIVRECADYVRSNYDSWDAEPLAFNMEKDFGLHGDYAE